MVLIQDLHGNVGVQRNIAEILKYLATGTRQQATGNRSVSTVARCRLPVASFLPVFVEGANGPFDVTLFRNHPNPWAKKQAVQRFLEDHTLSGAEIAAIEADESLHLWGIDDKALYLQNLAAFARASTRSPVPHPRNPIWNDYYAIARQRNIPMALHALTHLELLAKTPAPPSRVGLVAGGYHTEGLTQILRIHHIPYVVVTPRVQSLGEEQAYAASLRQLAQSLPDHAMAKILALTAGSRRNFDSFRWKVLQGVFLGALVWLDQQYRLSGPGITGSVIQAALDVLLGVAVLVFGISVFRRFYRRFILQRNSLALRDRFQEPAHTQNFFLQTGKHGNPGPWMQSPGVIKERADHSLRSDKVKEIIRALEQGQFCEMREGEIRRLEKESLPQLAVESGRPYKIVRLPREQPANRSELMVVYKGRGGEYVARQKDTFLYRIQLEIEVVNEHNVNFTSRLLPSSRANRAEAIHLKMEKTLLDYLKQALVDREWDIANPQNMQDVARLLHQPFDARRAKGKAKTIPLTIDVLATHDRYARFVPETNSIYWFMGLFNDPDQPLPVRQQETLKKLGHWAMDSEVEHALTGKADFFAEPEVFKRRTRLNGLWGIWNIFDFAGASELAEKAEAMKETFEEDKGLLRHVRETRDVLLHEHAWLTGTRSGRGQLGGLFDLAWDILKGRQGPDLLDVCTHQKMMPLLSVQSPGYLNEKHAKLGFETLNAMFRNMDRNRVVYRLRLWEFEKFAAQLGALNRENKESFSIQRSSEMGRLANGYEFVVLYKAGSMFYVEPEDEFLHGFVFDPFQRKLLPNKATYTTHTSDASDMARKISEDVTEILRAQGWDPNDPRHQEALSEAIDGGLIEIEVQRAAPFLGKKDPHSKKIYLHQKLMSKKYETLRKGLLAYALDRIIYGDTDFRFPSRAFRTWVRAVGIGGVWDAFQSFPALDLMAPAALLRKGFYDAHQKYNHHDKEIPNIRHAQSDWLGAKGRDDLERLLEKMRQILPRLSFIFIAFVAISLFLHSLPSGFAETLSSAPIPIQADENLWRIITRYPILSSFAGGGIAWWLIRSTPRAFARTYTADKDIPFAALTDSSKIEVLKRLFLPPSSLPQRSA